MTREQENAFREELQALPHDEKQNRTRCIFVGGEHNGFTCTEAYVEQHLCNGKHSPDWSGERNNPASHMPVVPYAVLDNVPEVSGYTHMWDGDKIRYETWEVYNMMCN